MALEKVNRSDDPERCQSNDTMGTEQCWYKSAPESQYCMRHGGNKAAESNRKQALRNYRLNQFHQRIGELGNSPDIKSLRDEIGILRIIMEERLNRCMNASDLVLQSGAISDLVMKIDKVVTSCHKLEGSMGKLLDKQILLQFADQVITIITSEDIAEDVLERMSSKLLKLVGSIDESISDTDS